MPFLWNPARKLTRAVWYRPIFVRKPHTMIADFSYMKSPVGKPS